MRFGQLLKRIDGISKKMLTQTLRAMERNGLVQRVVYPVVPPVVEYSLTPLGQTLIEPVRRSGSGHTGICRKWRRLAGSMINAIKSRSRSK